MAARFLMQGGTGMSRPARKMVNLSIEETSGVDHPAHLHEGWLVMKAASDGAVLEALDDSVESPSDVTEKSTEEVPMETTEEVKAEKPSYEDLEKALAEATEKIAEMAKAAEPEETETDAEDIMKSAPEEFRKAFESMQKSIDDAVAAKEATEAELRKERGERADADAIVKARDAFAHLGLDAEQVGPALRRLAETDSDLAKSVEDVLTAANAKVESADIFSEIGKSARPSGSSYEQAEAMAKAAVAGGKSATFEQALAAVYTEQPELYNQYLAEQGK